MQRCQCIVNATHNGQTGQHGKTVAPIVPPCLTLTVSLQQGVWTMQDDTLSRCRVINSQRWLPGPVQAEGLLTQARLQLP